MSTRANIEIKYKDKELYLYSHYDGYPDGGVGDEIKDTVIAEKWDSTAILIELIKLYELTDNIHGDIEFLYTLDLNDGILICRHVNKDEDIEPLKIMIKKGE